MSFFYCLICSFLRTYFRVFYRLSIYGTVSLHKGKALLAPNHTSFLDPPLIAATWPEEVHFLARASLFRYPIWGKLLSKLNAHPIRGTTHDTHTLRLVCQLLIDNKKVVIFPEGQRSRTGDLQVIKSGIAMLALRAECPIIPVYIKGTFEAWPRHHRWPKFGSSIICVFGQPLIASTCASMNKKQRQEYLTEQVQSKLEELRLWLEAGANGEPP